MGWKTKPFLVSHRNIDTSCDLEIKTCLVSQINRDKNLTRVSLITEEKKTVAVEHRTTATYSERSKLNSFSMWYRQGSNEIINGRFLQVELIIFAVMF